jgi:hypothetical protein
MSGLTGLVLFFNPKINGVISQFGVLDLRTSYITTCQTLEYSAEGTPVLNLNNNSTFEHIAEG